jgi:predicted NBD/HSP70 family sugar kinase
MLTYKQKVSKCRLKDSLMTKHADNSLMRRINRSAILKLLRDSSPLSRTQIARKLGMSLPTVMRIVDDLIEERLVEFCGQGESTGGRPSSLLEFNGPAYAILGIDLGESKCLGMIADLSGNIQYEQAISLTRDAPAEAYLQQLIELIDQLLHVPRPSTQPILGIGVGAPGITLVPDGVVVWAPSLGWRDLPLQSILTKRFALPVSVDNDANLAALGEWGFGANNGAQSLVSITFGTGIGAGIVIDGAVYRGHHQAAAEIGYMLPGVQFLRKHYDQFGALEAVASGHGIIQRAHQLLQQANVPIPAEGLSTEYIFTSARQATEWAQQVINDTVDYLSLAIANIGALLDPEVVVLGGSIAASADLLIGPILERLEGVTPYTPRLVASTLGRHATVLGTIMQVMNATDEYFLIKKLD